MEYLLLKKINLLETDSRRSFYLVFKTAKYYILKLSLTAFMWLNFLIDVNPSEFRQLALHYFMILSS